MKPPHRVCLQVILILLIIHATMTMISRITTAVILDLAILKESEDSIIHPFNLIMAGTTGTITSTIHGIRLTTISDGITGIAMLLRPAGHLVTIISTTRFAIIRNL